MKVIDKREAANRVLEYISKSLAVVDIEIILGSYQNGREQGYTITHIDYNSPVSNNEYRTHAARVLNSQTFCVIFSECRNSDAIVVYLDNHIPNQSIRDISWENCKSFDTTEEAGQFIVDCLLKRLIKMRK